MARGTYSPPKPPTARQVQSLMTRYEAVFNDVVEATKRFDPESIAGIEGRWIRETAFTLHGELSALYAHVADEENAQKGPRA